MKHSICHHNHHPEDTLWCEATFIWPSCFVCYHLLHVKAQCSSKCGHQSLRCKDLLLLCLFLRRAICPTVLRNKRYCWSVYVIKIYNTDYRGILCECRFCTSRCTMLIFFLVLLGGRPKDGWLENKSTVIWFHIRAILISLLTYAMLWFELG